MKTHKNAFAGPIYHLHCTHCQKSTLARTQNKARQKKKPEAGRYLLVDTTGGAIPPPVPLVWNQRTRFTIEVCVPITQIIQNFTFSSSLFCFYELFLFC